MKKALFVGALIAATLAPIAAQAQDNRHDRHEAGKDRRDGRDYRHDRHDDRRDFRHDRRDDRRDYRESHRDDHRGGRWNAPSGYRSFGNGAIISRGYYAPRYYVNDWRRHRLPAPPYGFYRYVRHFNDVLLVNTRNSRVVRVYRNFYR